MQLSAQTQPVQNLSPFLQRSPDSSFERPRFPRTSASLKHPGDWDPLWVFGHRLQGGFDGAVGLVQVVVDDAQVKIVAVRRLDFGALAACPVQLFILPGNDMQLFFFCFLYLVCRDGK